MKDGEYDFIIKNDNSEIVIMFDNTKKNIKIGHSSLVDREKYKKEFNKWNKNKIEINSEKDEIKFAGEIKIKGNKFIKWTDKSGHYLPLKKEAKKINLDIGKYGRCKIPNEVNNSKKRYIQNSDIKKKTDYKKIFILFMLFIILLFLGTFFNKFFNYITRFNRIS